MNFFITHFKGICIGLMFLCLVLLVFTASSEKEEEVGVEVLNEAPMGVGRPIGKILGYESDIIERVPFDPPLELGYPAMGVAPNEDYTFIRVDVTGHLLCSKVDKSIWKLVPVERK